MFECVTLTDLRWGPDSVQGSYVTVCVTCDLSFSVFRWSVQEARTLTAGQVRALQNQAPHVRVLRSNIRCMGSAEMAQKKRGAASPGKSRENSI